MFEKFLLELQKNNDINIKYKDESLFMKFLNFLIGFFVKGFMTKFTTTIGNTVYFPNKAFITDNEHSAIQILAHEYVHISDEKNNKLTYSISYLFPQILALIAILSIPLIVIFGSYFWFLLLFLGMLAPIPAYWRMKWELKGYTMSIFVIHYILNKNTINRDSRKAFIDKTLRFVVKNISDNNFKGWSYFKMWPWGVEEALNDNVTKIISGDIFDKDEAYEHVKKALDATL